MKWHVAGTHLVTIASDGDRKHLAIKQVLEHWSEELTDFFIKVNLQGKHLSE